jgi:cytochrome c oxidase subunit 2
MTSTDVIHSFFVPAFRIKQDVVPRRYTYAWFQATKPGIYRLYCAEYCGTDHSMMKTTVVVLEPGGYERYLNDKNERDNNIPLPDLGKKLYEAKGCVACHTVDGTKKVGPTFLDDFGSSAALKDGTTITVDETYIRRSILDPQGQARPGYPPSMPSFEGQLKQREIDGLIAYIKSLKK